MARVKPIVTRTALELAEVMGLEPADAQDWELQLQLSNRIAQEVAHRKLTHAEAAKIAGTSRSRLTGIINGGLQGVSTDLLLRVLANLGVRVKLSFTRAA